MRWGRASRGRSSGISIAAQVTSALGLPIGGLLVGAGMARGLRGQHPAGAHRDRLYTDVDPAGRSPAATHRARELVSGTRPPAWHLRGRGHRAHQYLTSASRPGGSGASSSSLSSASYCGSCARGSCSSTSDAARQPAARSGRSQGRRSPSRPASTVLYGYGSGWRRGRAHRERWRARHAPDVGDRRGRGPPPISRRGPSSRCRCSSKRSILGGGTAILFVEQNDRHRRAHRAQPASCSKTSTSNQAALYTATTAQQIGVASASRTSSYLGDLRRSSASRSSHGDGRRPAHGRHRAARRRSGPFSVALDRKLPSAGIDRVSDVAAHR